MRPGLARPVAITAICFVTATLAWGSVFYGHSVYMEALSRERGWSVSLISQAILVFWLSTLPSTFCVGLMIDRFGSALVVAIGGVCIGGGLLALGFIQAPWQLFVIYIALGIGYPTLASTMISATLAPWFDRGFGAALAVALSGASAGGAILPLLIVTVAARDGFAFTMQALGASILLIVLAAAGLLAVLGRPERVRDDKARPADFSYRAVLSRPLFWNISFAAAFALGGQVGLLAHQLPIVITRSDPTTAALTVTLVAVTSAIGRVAVGWLARHVEAALLAVFSYSIHGIGIAMVLFASSTTGAIIACGVAGVGVGAIVMLPPIIVRQAFGLSGYGGTFGMTNVIMYMLAALSPFLVGLLRDATGSYDASLAMLTAMEAIAVVLVLRVLYRLRRL